MNNLPPDRPKRPNLKLIITNPELDKLDAVLRSFFKPTFLFISNPDDNGDIQVIISCPAFETMSIQARVGNVVKLIQREVPELLINRLVVVQAYSNQQMEVIRGFFGFKEEE